MQYHSGNVPSLQYFHHQFDKISTRITDVDRRLNDINQKLESIKSSLQKLDSGSNVGKEIKEIKACLSESQSYIEKNRKIRLPL